MVAIATGNKIRFHSSQAQMLENRISLNKSTTVLFWQCYNLKHTQLSCDPQKNKDKGNILQ